MKKPITVLLRILSLATTLHAQNISSYSIITTGSVLKGGTNGSQRLRRIKMFLERQLAADNSIGRKNRIFKA